MSPAEAAVPVFDALVRRRTVSGYTVEHDATYLFGRQPTLTYRMYRDRRGAAHVLRFIADMRELGARISVTAAVGNLATPRGIRRNAQVTITAVFDREWELLRALALVRTRYHARGSAPLPGSWELPDVRLTGCAPLAGTMPVIAQSLRTGDGVAVTLTRSTHRLLPDLRLRPVHVLSEWAPLLDCTEAAA
ncbi:MAG: hypothetical protein WAM30_02390 [Candidatus Dormiibacterota bacterium]